jgi:hypothetical protein
VTCGSFIVVKGLVRFCELSDHPDTDHCVAGTVAWRRTGTCEHSGCRCQTSRDGGRIGLWNRIKLNLASVMIWAQINAPTWAPFIDRLLHPFGICIGH